MNNKLKIIFCSVFAALMLWLCIGVTCVAGKLAPNKTITNNNDAVSAFTNVREIYLQSATETLEYSNKYKHFYSNVRVQFDAEENWIDSTEDEYENFTGVKRTSFNEIETIDSSNSYYGWYKQYSYILFEKYDSNLGAYSYYKVSFKKLADNNVNFSFVGNTFSFKDATNKFYTISITDTNIYKQFDDDNRIVAIKTDEYDITITY